MQYILTQEEYDELKRKQELEFSITTKQLQTLCTKIATEMPVVLPWGSHEVRPWGCILTDDGAMDYCDDCPVQQICPHPYKEWSK